MVSKAIQRGFERVQRGEVIVSKGKGEKTNTQIYRIKKMKKVSTYLVQVGKGKSEENNRK